MDSSNASDISFHAMPDLDRGIKIAHIKKSKFRNRDRTPLKF